MAIKKLDAVTTENTRNKNTDLSFTYFKAYNASREFQMRRCEATFKIKPVIVFFTDGDFLKRSQTELPFPIKKSDPQVEQVNVAAVEAPNAVRDFQAKVDRSGKYAGHVMSIPYDIKQRFNEFHSSIFKVDNSEGIPIIEFNYPGAVDVVSEDYLYNGELFSVGKLDGDYFAIQPETKCEVYRQSKAVVSNIFQINFSFS